MYSRRKKPKYVYSSDIKSNGKRLKISTFLIIVFVLLLISSTLLKNLATKMAVSDATDVVTKAVNDAINEVIGNGEYGFDYFISLEKDSAGDISAVTSNNAATVLLALFFILNLLFLVFLAFIFASPCIQIPVNRLSSWRQQQIFLNLQYNHR